MKSKRTAKIPQYFDWLATIFTLLLFLTNHFFERGENTILKIIGVVVLFFALVFIFPPFFLFRRYGKIENGDNYMNTTVVVDQGVYSFIRHPQYFGYILLVSGLILLYQNFFTLIIGIIAIIFYFVHTIAEERYCINKFGDEYKNYLTKVPRFNLILGIIRRFSRFKAQNK